MMRIKKHGRTALPPRLIAVATAMLASGGPTGAWALGIDAGNPDVAVRLDTSVRYNLGVRASKANDKALNTLDYDDSDSKFERGDVVTNRLDLMSEFDVVYKRRHGLRISAAGWYDHAYHNTTASGNPAFNIPGLGNVSDAYPNGEYTGFTKRWNRGPSGEFLDAFVFGGVDIGNVPVDVKLGQHNVYWGESLFSFVHGVSYSQGPVDVRKAFTNPGAQAKELFLPLNQISAQAQLANNFSVATQYLLDWKPSRVPDGGTYLGLADYFTAGGGTYANNPALMTALAGQFGLPPGSIAPIPFVGTLKAPDKKRGDWGVKATWRPEALDGTLGFYYREYTDKMPQIVAGGVQTALLPALALPSSVGFSYLEKNKLYGVSLAKEIGGVSVGAEIVQRKNTGLLMSRATFLGSEPRGDTYHAVVNALTVLPRNALFDTGSFTAEIAYSRLGKVTANAGNYNGVGYGCLDPVTGSPSRDKMNGCATKDNWSLAMQFVPQWNQVVAGVDLSMPMVYQVGLKGNSPVLFGGYEGNGSYSVGLAADIFGKYNLALNYNGYLVKYKSTPNALNQQPSIGAVNGIGYIGDRNWVSLTFKTAF